MPEYSGRVVSVTDIGEGTVALEFKIDERLEALPGQFLLLRAEINGSEETGYYTISSPTVDTTFEVTVGVDPESTLSPWLAQRSVGDEIGIEGPYGNIAYDDDGDVVTIAGGPGIGPAIAIAERATNFNSNAALIYQDDSPAYQDRLSALSDCGQAIQIVQNDKEKLHDAISEYATDGTVYIFGFDEFCSRASDIVESSDVNTDDLHIESFG
ncbi:FAD-binding oxidoreductase [Halobellus sp. GM3]|uniref:FAD-binding oxidoreductase n=1 Tax=Halobellus sp. GM3 TaxID=3458410 RepID=UPI00403D9142